MASSAIRRRNNADEAVTESKPRRSRKSKQYDALQEADVQQPPRTSVSLLEGIIIFAVYAGFACSAVYAMHWVPTPLPSDVSDAIFSEGRALQFTKALAQDIGMRQVSTPGIERAADYIERELEEITLLPSVRDDVSVEVERQTTSGAVNFKFIGSNFTNVYYNLTNIVVKIVPKGVESRPGLLVSAHYDSTIGTVGASDCASCVGVCMELVRVLLTNSSIHLSTPVFVLLNGGEETLMQAAHGFMSDPQNRDRLGAFINVESTGPYGLPLLFQHTGSWTAATYAKSAKYPRGTSFSQDFFDSGIIPADTDYKMFSSRHKGTLPGLDIAFTLGGSAYHTDQDVVERIRPGTLQELGEDLVGAVQGFTSVLAARESGIGVTDGDHEDSAVYFDLWTMAMVVYSKSNAAFIHGTPLLMLFLFPPYAAAMTGLAGKNNNNNNGRPAVSISYIAILSSCFTYACAVVLAVGLPCIIGMARALIAGPGKGIVFFAHKYLACLIYIPAAVCGFIIPFVSPASHDIVPITLGGAYFWGLLGVWATQSGLGLSVYPFLWTVGVGPTLLVTLQSSRYSQLLALTVGTSLGTTLGVGSSAAMLYHVLDKITLTGRAAGFFGPSLVDGGIGSLFGLSVVLSVGTIGPPLISAAHKLAKRLVPVLLLVSLSAAALGSMFYHPYTVEHPQRVFTQHLHVVSEEGSVDSYWAVCGTDVNPVEPLLSQTYRAAARPITEHALRYLYPLSSMLQGVLLPAPPPDTSILPSPPQIMLEQREHVSVVVLRHHIFIDLKRPCWAILNISGPLLHWSFTQQLVPLHPDSTVPSYFVRYAGNQGSEHWRFWVDTQPQVSLRLELTAKYHQTSALVEDFSAQFPDYVSNTKLIVYHRDVDFKADEIPHNNAQEE